ncbi:thymidine phosphorylase family protein [Shinella sp. 838]|uniref:thymidine phosphorylase family protein n=1 Tax=Shinella sp. 838 TaxID=3038164 RepID=UPI000AC13015
MNSVRSSHPPLRARRLGLHAQHQAIVVMRTDCPACKSEGLTARSHIQVRAGNKCIQAELLQIDTELLPMGDIGLSQAAWELLAVQDGDEVEISHPPALSSLAHVRSRIFGQRFDRTGLDAIIADVVAHRYTDVHLAAFLTASATPPLDLKETIDLTGAMIAAGQRLKWDTAVVIDKHCIGGLPGNRTTPIVVAIAAANGLIMPKTSSRAITSPAGTADTMETLAPVNLDIAGIRRVVQAEGGCIAWGGAVQLSPADDIFIRVERDLDIDTEGQLVASVLSKKIAAGSTHVVIDIPVGPTAKVRTTAAADSLAQTLVAVGEHFGLAVTCMKTDGCQPVGMGIGPALEAHDVLAVLQNTPGAPMDLRERAAALAGAALEIAGVAANGGGKSLACETLDSGAAWDKFRRICTAQGGMRSPGHAEHIQTIRAKHDGVVVSIDNRNLARVAKLAGAPQSSVSGIRLLSKLGDAVVKEQPIFEIHTAVQGELIYAAEFLQQMGDVIQIEST